MGKLETAAAGPTSEVTPEPSSTPEPATTPKSASIPEPSSALAPAPASADTYVLLEPSRRPKVAALKRAFELWLLDRDFHNSYLANPHAALERTGLDVDPRAAELLFLLDAQETKAALEHPDQLPEAFVWYWEFVEGRARQGIIESTRDVPSDPRFRDWGQRQRRRCEREMGPHARLMMHLPVVFELSSGCSVGCPFCALSAGKLKSLFRHTDENAALWRDVLARLHRVVGDAAGRAACYYACEPLDNPDYELFLEDFYNEFGLVPQTTTAVATRDIERTRSLLRWGQTLYEHVDRISVLSKRDFDLLISAFSPDELVFTELLPQFEDAPGCTLTKAGRNLGAEEGRGGTIACASGFVVNMAERSVRLLTPVSADDEHPTGERILETASFADGEGLERVVLGMIERHMKESVRLTSLFGTGR